MNEVFLTCEQVGPSKWKPRFHESDFLAAIDRIALAGQAYALEFAPEPEVHSRQLWRIEHPTAESGFRLTMTEWMAMEGGMEPTHMIELVFDEDGKFLGAGRFLAFAATAEEIQDDDPDLEIVCSIWSHLGGLTRPTTEELLDAPDSTSCCGEHYPDD
ncbi:hypothetical protein [Desulfovibrio inopinatus]|uniref:hypothetical protein n=1 Tax=Desulfovibrio inopinatus TaxID=102109 RepID=UPI0004067287|nr:hypothetical protein [Desulfovibrio inopinatus]